MTIRQPFIYLALIAVSLMVYYPSITAEITWIDDVELFQFLRNRSHISLTSIFVPNSATGLYYRPITVASYLLNWRWCGGATEWMHLVNILIHAANSMLCYAILTRITPNDPSRLNLLGALLFTVHPIATESICWISGRTDPLAGFFVLASLWFLFSYRQTGSPKHLIPALALLFTATLSKEFALAFVPGMLLIMYNKDLKSTGRMVTRVAIYGGLTVGVFFLLRKFAFNSDVRSIKTTLVVMNVDYLYTLKIFLQSAAFYLKKVFYPYPLDFSIQGINFIYASIGWPLLLLLLVMCCRFTLASAFFSSGLFLLAPSFLIAFGQIAWTPYAERYAYIPSAFFIMSGVIYLQNYSATTARRIATLIIACVVVVFGISTHMRSKEWQTNISLAESIVRINPANKEVQTGLGIMYLNKGDFAKTHEHLTIAEKLFSFDFDARAGIVLAELYGLQGDTNAALKKVNAALAKTKFKSTEGLELKLTLLTQKINTTTGSEKREFYAEKIKTYKALYAIQKSEKLLRLIDIHRATMDKL